MSCNECGTFCAVSFGEDEKKKADAPSYGVRKGAFVWADMLFLHSAGYCNLIF